MPEAVIHVQTNVSRARVAATNNGSGYSVYDPVGQKIGIVERVFANSDGEPEYIRLRIGLFGTNRPLRDADGADPGTVRRECRGEKNPRHKVGDSCIPLKLEGTRS